MTPRSVLITGIGGQDGHYLTREFLERGYAVSGTLLDAAHRPPELPATVETTVLDLANRDQVTDLIAGLRPSLLINLAAQSSVGRSFQSPEETLEITGMGVATILEAIRLRSPETRLIQASSGEIFGTSDLPHSERTPWAPRSPYAAAKMLGHALVGIYRESYSIWASSAILYNHESPQRGRQFVTRKITQGAARIALGLDHELRLGNLKVARDWGFAGDYARAVGLMAEADDADDFIVATGTAHPLEEFVCLAFERVGLSWTDHVISDPGLVRPSDPEVLVGDPSKLRERLGWEPRVTFPELVAMMVDADLERCRRQAAEPTL